MQLTLHTVNIIANAALGGLAVVSLMFIFWINRALNNALFVLAVMVLWQSLVLAGLEWIVMTFLDPFFGVVWLLLVFLVIFLNISNAADMATLTRRMFRLR